MRLQAAGRQRPRQGREDHGGEQQIEPQRVGGNRRQQRIGLGQQREVPQGCIARLIDVRARQPRGERDEEDCRGRGRGRGQDGPGDARRQAVEPRQIATEGEACQQSAVEEEREDVDEDQHAGDGEPCSNAGAERGGGEAWLESCTQQGQPETDVEIEEAAEQRGVAGKEGKARLPPVRAAEDDAVEGNGA